MTHSRSLGKVMANLDQKEEGRDGDSRQREQQAQSPCGRKAHHSLEELS